MGLLKAGATITFFGQVLLGTFSQTYSHLKTARLINRLEYAETSGSGGARGS
ncbi:hypothetical protein [Nodularia sp. NIES-3585]|uniref:hypothetical protein n=1 Tax=Nodularia sp. NIES-3585 TaxID=1973477 RepID=UPI00159628D3|nr:hypothetical protein [Nodularia sp. NIES-3585]